MAAARAVHAVTVYGSGDTAVGALDGVTVEFPASRYTAIMGPSGSGKSTLMHSVAGLDDLTSGEVWIGDTELGSLSDKALTATPADRLRVPVLEPDPDADRRGEHHPAARAGRRQARCGLARQRDHDRRVGRPSRSSTERALGRAAARRRGAGACQPAGALFADEPTGNLDSRAGAEILEFMRRAVDELNQTIVMVSHDPTAAAYSDNVLFLVDGRAVDEMAEPSAERVLDCMKRFGD
jgi:putative ABC transport system ATP-binding protein